MVTALWTRMIQLFGHKWHSNAGPTKHQNGKYTQEFLLWCRKLDGLSDEAYQRGFWMLEHKVKEAARMGEEEWPPSYAGFLGMCERPHGEMAQRYFSPPALEDKTKKERDREVGKREAKKLLEQFD